MTTKNAFTKMSILIQNFNSERNFEKFLSRDKKVFGPFKSKLKIVIMILQDWIDSQFSMLFYIWYFSPIDNTLNKLKSYIPSRKKTREGKQCLQQIGNNLHCLHTIIFTTL